MRKVQKVYVFTKIYALRQGIMVIWVGKIPLYYKPSYVMRLRRKSSEYEYEIRMNFLVYQSEKRKQ